MGVRGRRKRGVKRALRATDAFRPRLNWQTVRLLVAFLLFTVSLMPSWHYASAKTAVSGDLSQVQLPPGVQLEDLEASICRQGDGNTSGIPYHDETLACGKCLLCHALHHLPLVPERGFDCAVFRRSAAEAFLSYRLALTAARDMPGQKRPRAPPRI